nr:RecName: Full=Laccase; AltName: Full=Benzenediol:oxygen oxidoreductase; AltName: Full=Diphenol oxidase; AltName: Full=Urishiol oxidase [Lepiota magnispora]
VTIGKEGTLT